MPDRHIFFLGGVMHFEWNPEKNDWLKRERRVSFEEIALLLAEGKLWKVADHPNPKKYPNQRVFLVPIDDFVYFVPYVVQEDAIFLKTAFPHRQATKDYLRERKKNG